MIGFGTIRKATWESWSVLLSALLVLAIVRRLVGQHEAGQAVQDKLIWGLGFVMIGLVLGLISLPKRLGKKSKVGRIRSKDKLKTGTLMVGVLTSALLGGLFALTAILPAYADRWAATGNELSLYQEILLWVATAWSRFWWLGTAIVVLSAALIALVIWGRTRAELRTPGQKRD